MSARSIAVITAAVGVVLGLAACGASGTGPTLSPGAGESASAVPTPTPTPLVTRTPTAAPTATPGATPAEAGSESLDAVAFKVYPPCTTDVCQGHGTSFTTCTGAGPNIYSACPLTARLAAQLLKDISGVASAPDVLGGGQDPEWESETLTGVTSASGGVVHVVLGAGSLLYKTDLVIVMQSGNLLVDDLYCTGADLSTTDAYAAGWVARSPCES